MPGGAGSAAIGLDILSGLLKGMAAYQTGEYNAKVAENNALVAMYGAGDARVRGQLAAETLQLRGSQMAGAQTSAFAGAGVDVSSGSAIVAKADTKGMSDFDALVAENNAAREAWGYERRADTFREQAALDRYTASNQLTESILGGINQAAHDNAAFG